MNKNAAFSGSRWQIWDMCSPPLVRAPNATNCWVTINRTLETTKKIPHIQRQKATVRCMEGTIMSEIKSHTLWVDDLNWKCIPKEVLNPMSRPQPIPSQRDRQFPDLGICLETSKRLVTRLPPDWGNKRLQFRGHKQKFSSIPKTQRKGASVGGSPVERCGSGGAHHKEGRLPSLEGPPWGIPSWRSPAQP